MNKQLELESYKVLIETSWVLESTFLEKLIIEKNICLSQFLKTQYHLLNLTEWGPFLYS